MSQTAKQKTGEIGENLACQFLKQAGYRIKGRNYRRKWGEIDIIAEQGNDLCFVEVKTVTRATRSSDDYEPEDNVHPWKLKRLSRAIQTYLLDHDIPDEVEWRLDVLAVYLDQAGNKLKIEWLRDVF